MSLHRLIWAQQARRSCFNCMDALTMDSAVAPFEAPDRVPLSLQSRSRLWGQCEISFAIESASKGGLV